MNQFILCLFLEHILRPVHMFIYYKRKVLNINIPSEKIWDFCKHKLKIIQFAYKNSLIYITSLEQYQISS